MNLVVVMVVMVVVMAVLLLVVLFVDVDLVLEKLAVQSDPSFDDFWLFLCDLSRLGDQLGAVFDRYCDLVLWVLEDLDADPEAMALGLLTWPVRDASPTLRAELRRAAGQVAERLLPRLLVLAEAGDREVRQHALSVLGKTGRADAIALLQRVALTRQTERELRTAALGALGRLAASGHAPARQALRQALRTLPWEARLQALAALARSDSPEAQAELTAALADRDGFIRELAIRGLGELGPTGHRLLLDRARPDDLPEVRRALREVLLPVSQGGSPLAERARQMLGRMDR